MEITPVVQIFAFAVFALIAVLGALGMATTMSMFRSGIFLMASFIGVAGLFVLLLADLLALLQVMMYIGGMLVMILFMVLFSNDPGGAMMTSMMELPLIEKFFSLGLTNKKDSMNGGEMKHEGGHDKKSKEQTSDEKHDLHAKHDEEKDENQQQKSSHGGHENHAQMQSDNKYEQSDKDERNDESAKSDDKHGEKNHGEHGKGGDKHGEMSDMQMGGMNMAGMSMTTPIKKQAAILAILVGLFLGGLVLLRPAWKITNQLPDQSSAERVGDMLMEKYMIAFEGAGLLILLGIFGSVMVSRPASHPDSSERDKIKAAVDEKPAPVEIDPLEPFYKIDLPTEEDEYEQKKKEKMEMKDAEKSDQSEKREAEK